MIIHDEDFFTLGTDESGAVVLDDAATVKLSESLYRWINRQSCVAPVDPLKQTPATEALNVTYETEQTDLSVNE